MGKAGVVFSLAQEKQPAVAGQENQSFQLALQVKFLLLDEGVGAARADARAG